MSQFNFRLEKVWQHRRQLVDKNSLDVARADRRVARLARQIVELEGTISRHNLDLAPREGQKLRASDLISETAWLNHLHSLRSDLEGQLEEATRDLNRFRSRLTESWRDLEVLSRLKDRQETNWKSARDKRERKEEDEIGRNIRIRHGGTKFSG